jgi:ribosomal protein L7/L12
MSSDGAQDIKIAQLERRIAALEAHLGMHPPQPDASISPDVIALIESGNLIGAIKAVREIEGLGLAEAKARVEAIAATR